jgi:2-keto-3-deoxy-L-rhamnonate aldolase RhmA
VLLGHPTDKPQALIDALSRELSAIAGVNGAWLMLAMRAGQADQSWMLGIEHTGDWNAIRAAIGRAVASNVLAGRMLDAVPMNDSPFAETLRTGIPVIAAKRGFFSKLFR